MGVARERGWRTALVLLTCAVLLGGLWTRSTPAAAGEEGCRRRTYSGEEVLICMPDEGVAPGIERAEEPVVVSGADLPELTGTPTDELFVYAYRSGGLRQIPFQVDEVVTEAYTSTMGSPLDGDDEVVFMASDLAGELPDADVIANTLPVSPTWYAVEVSDPLSPTKKGWAYVVRSSGLTETFTQTYVSLDPATKRITTTHYSAGFLSTVPGFEYLALHGSDQDLLDRTKIRLQVFGVILTEESILSDPPFAVKTGPVRVIVPNRGTMGYRAMLHTWLREEISGATGARLSTDFNANVAGATFYDANTTAGVTIDGSPDDVAATPLSAWWQVSHETGTLIQVSDGSGVGGVQTNYYKDDSTPDASDTGDDMSYGDVGLEAESPNATVAYETTLYVLPGDLTNVGELYASYTANPLQVTTMVGGGGPRMIYLPLVVRR